MKKLRILRFIIFLWVFLIWGHSLQPADISSGESGFFLAYLSKLLPAVFGGPWGEFSLRKLAHFTEYFILGVLLTIERWKSGHRQWSDLWNVFFVGLGISFIDETIQLFVVGRSGEIRDVWIDFAGVFVGSLFTYWVCKLINSRR